MHTLPPCAVGLCALFAVLVGPLDPRGTAARADTGVRAEADASRPTLHGRRAIAIRQGRRVHWFDPARLPRVGLPDARPRALVWLGADGDWTWLRTRTQRAHGMTFLTTDEAGLSRGPGTLGLFAGRFLEATWAVEWRDRPTAEPHVAELDALGARLAAARTHAAWRRWIWSATRPPLVQPPDLSHSGRFPPAEPDPRLPHHDDPEVYAAEREVEYRRRWYRMRADALANAPVSPDTRLWLLVEVARSKTAAGDPDAADMFDEAEVAWIEAATQAVALAVPSEHTRGLCAAAFMAMDGSDYSTADRYVKAARAVAIDDPAGQALVAHVGGVLERRTGRWRAAEQLFAEGAHAAGRAGEERLLPFFRQSRALLALDLGDHQRAVELIQPLVEKSTLRPLQRAYAAINAGYIFFRAMARGTIPLDLDRVRHFFEQAELLSEQVDTAAHLHVNRALVEMRAARWAAAAEHLARIRDDAVGTEVAAAVALVHGRLALAQGRTGEAERRFAEADDAATRWWGQGGGDYGWRADLGRGRIARAAGDLAGARRHLRRARERLARLAAFTDPLTHRVAFFADRDDLARVSLDVALEMSDLEEAFTLADRNQARVLRSMMWAVHRPGPDDPRRAEWTALQDRIADASDALRLIRTRGEVLAPAERAPWRRELRAAEEKQRRAIDGAVAFLDAQLRQLETRSSAAVRRALAPGQTILVIGRGTQGRVALWANTDGYHHTPLPDRALDALPEPPWETTHLYVVASGQRDVVQQAFRGAVDQPWSVSLLPAADLLAASPRRASGAPVILADPTSDLPAARAEGRRLADTLPGSTLHLQRAATRARFKASLQRARLVHFAGHGELDPSQPWSTHLVLAGGARFDVFDVLSTTAGGGLAVLNGCETGSDVLATREDVLGLPEALMVAGASAVVASSVKLPEKDAARFTELFYAHDGPRRPGPALRATMRRLRDDGFETWHAWRLVGRPIMTDVEPSEDPR